METRRKKTLATIGSTVFLLTLGIGSWYATFDSASETQKDREIAAIVERKLPVIHKERLIRAIIQVESSGNPNAESKKGAIGLMQIRWSVWKEELKRRGIAKKRSDLFNPQINKAAGRYILAHYMDRHDGNLEKALHGYSGGAKRYYQKVMEAYNVR
jgi:hypothetical protein